MSPPTVEPVGFGDALIQLEALTLDEVSAQPAGGCVLVGVGQGGSMALVLAAIWPELFSAVIAIGAMWPKVPGWQPPDLAMPRTPVLLAGGWDGLSDCLTQRGAAVSEIASAEAGPVLADACRQWLSANSRR
ncbi:alpha/beta hydrolase-fold protein [Croceicoccus bisphenolivorans]|uniref:alpha/beta hydrolase-fold protein n=1 Tax=Croceicoccus bisphenolivorans TaxID=1783232 RepID=UPI0008365962|nr:alpha/beta hydrolase-fold protein [Croceicoccus bisphenolivorans]